MPIADFLGVDMCTPIVDLLEELGFESLEELDEWVTEDPINAVQLDVYLNAIGEVAKSLQKRISKIHAEYSDGSKTTRLSSTPSQLKTQENQQQKTLHHKKHSTQQSAI